MQAACEATEETRRIAPYLPAFHAYAATFFANAGNYLSFGDSKIIPDMPSESFLACVRACLRHTQSHIMEGDAAGHATPHCMDVPFDHLYSVLPALVDAVYDLAPVKQHLNYRWSGYYGGGVTRAEIEAITAWAESQRVALFNTRVFKCEDGSLELRVASARTDGVDAARTSTSATCALCTEHDAPEHCVACMAHPDPTTDDVVTLAPGTYKLPSGQAVHVRYGDFAPFMARIVAELTQAHQYATNAAEQEMIRKFSASYLCGDVARHMEGSRVWVKNVAPAVETYQGFIEVYKDPYAVRGEYEGFVAVVNREQSKRFESLVHAAGDGLLEQLPWGGTPDAPSPWEKAEFMKPDFTALEVLAFASAGVPAGISLPNYDDIRCNFGFKNVSLSNVLAARAWGDRVTFLAHDVQEQFKAWQPRAFEVQVGLHELLGHGSGALLKEDKDGVRNFPDGLTNPITGKPVTSWYGAGQTYDSVFGALGPGMEECRAEAVGLLLCPNERVLQIFGYEPGSADAQALVTVNWLNMCRAGLLGLEHYDPEAGWKQAHMRARFALLRCLLDASATAPAGTTPLVEIVGWDAATGAVHAAEGSDETSLHLRFYPDAIESVGLPAVRTFLHKLQTARATADLAYGEAVFGQITAVTPEWRALRDAVIAARRPRQLLAQPVLHIHDDARTGERAVTVEEPAATHAGVIESWCQRTSLWDCELWGAWRADWHAMEKQAELPPASA